MLAHCAAAELCQLARTASLLRDLSGSDRLWCRLFRAQFAAASPPVIGDGEPHRDAEGEEENAEAPAGWKRRYAQETLAYLKRREGFGTVGRSGADARPGNALSRSLRARLGLRRGEANDRRILMVGLDYAGKTSILYK